MALFTAIVATAALGATIYSGIQQSKAAKQQADAQREAQAAQGRASAVEAQRARIQQVREARIRRAQIVASAGAAGLGPGTSGIGGAVGSVSSQMAENIGVIGQQQTFAEQTAVALQRAADAGLKAQQWQMIGQFSNSIFQQAGGFTTIFKGNTPKPTTSGK